MDAKKIINGSKSHIKPDKILAPRFTNYVVNDYTTRDGTFYHNPHDEDPETAKKDVDNNPK